MPAKQQISGEHIKLGGGLLTEATGDVDVDPSGVDGDNIDITFTPVNYTPSDTPPEADNVDSLAAHLYGIDQQLNFSSIVQFQFAKDDIESSTGSTTFVQKLKLTTASLPAGDYKIEWYCEVAIGNKQQETEVRIQLNDAIDLTDVFVSFNEALQFRQVTGFDVRTVTAGIQTVDIDYRATANTAYIRRARLTMWKIV